MGCCLGKGGSGEPEFLDSKPLVGHGRAQFFLLAFDNVRGSNGTKIPVGVRIPISTESAAYFACVNVPPIGEGLNGNIEESCWLAARGPRS